MRISAAVAAVLLTGAALLGSAGTAAATAPAPGHERAGSSGTSLTLPLDLLGLPSLSLSSGSR